MGGNCPFPPGKEVQGLYPRPDHILYLLWSQCRKMEINKKMGINKNRVQSKIMWWKYSIWPRPKTMLQQTNGEDPLVAGGTTQSLPHSLSQPSISPKPCMNALEGIMLKGQSAMVACALQNMWSLYSNEGCLWRAQKIIWNWRVDKSLWEALSVLW